MEQRTGHKGRDRISYNAILRKTLTKNVPLNVLFEVTHKCNLNCRHCYISPKDEPELTFGEIDDILQQLAEKNSLFLTLSGGEPFIREDIFEIAASARRKGFTLTIYSNGTLITPQLADRIADLNVLQLGISIYGSKPSTHDAITQTPGSFKRSVNALKMLRERNIKTSLKFTLMKPNFQEFEATNKLADDLGADFSFGFIVAPKTDRTTKNLALRMGTRELKHIFNKSIIYPPEILEKKVNAKRVVEQINNAMLCGAGNNSCSISPHGDLQACLMLPLEVGNLRSTSFKDLWENSQVLNKLRNLRFSDLSDKCTECISFGKCFYCPGLAMLENGDFLSPVKFACQISKIEQSVVRSRA